MSWVLNIKICKCLVSTLTVITVKFLIVAASPIEAPPPNFKKITIFLQKVSYFENLQLKPHGDF